MALNAELGEILWEYKLSLKNCFMILIPSFAPAHLQCCYYAVNAAAGVFFLWLLIQLRQYRTVVALGSFSIKQTSLHFSHRDRFLAFKTHAFSKQVWLYVNVGLILHALHCRAVDKVMLCGC